MVIKSIFSIKANFCKIDLMHKYDEFLQKLVLENIVRENGDDYFSDVQIAYT